MLLCVMIITVLVGKNTIINQKTPSHSLYNYDVSVRCDNDYYYSLLLLGKMRIRSCTTHRLMIQETIGVIMGVSQMFESIIRKISYEKDLSFQSPLYME